MKILLTGGSGALGVELLKINKNIVCPTHEELDVCLWDKCKPYIDSMKPDIIIHAAAVTDNRIVEKNPQTAIETNIIGTANLSIICCLLKIRLIYISTDYVYKGDRGNYKESDDVSPFNLYSWTKLGGECAVKGVGNHLIIRTSFGKNKFEYKEAFVDKWTSKDYVDRIAPMVYEASISPLTGILNLGTERKTLYSHALETKNDVIPIKIENTAYNTPYDTSLNLQKWINYKSSKPVCTPHNKCRVCGSNKLVKYLDLGLLPIPNSLELTSKQAKEKERFPLQVMFCEDCYLSQLSVVVDPGVMFSYYTYRSSINGGYIKHCNNMANSLKEKFGLNQESFHIDIAGNDGALLQEFKKILHHKVLNVDPAANLTAIAEANGISCRTDFWSYKVGFDYQNTVDLITATNVYAHLDNVIEFIQACRCALHKNGVLIIENPYLIDFIENKEFDTIYHEHVSYWSVLPMKRICEENGMKLIDAEYQNIHGGTMRYTISRDDSRHYIRANVPIICEQERELGYDKIEAYSNWNKDVKKIIKEFGENLLKLKREGNTIIGFSASAKGTILLNSCGINTDIVSCIIDETPEKIGKYSPGSGIPIYGIEKIMKILPEYIILLSWNFKEEIMEKIEKLGWKGKFIVPIPEWQII